VPLPCGSAIPHAVAWAHSIYSVTPSAHLHITVPTSAYLPAFPAAFASWEIPLLSGMRLTPPPRGEPERVTPFLDIVCRGGWGLTVRRETWGMQPGARHQCPARERFCSPVSLSVLDQADNLRRLVVPDDDSRVSSIASPDSTLLGGIRREILRDRLSFPLHGLRVSRYRGERASPLHRGERNYTSTTSKLSKTSSVFVPHPWCRHHFEGTDRTTARYR
jgi:hypothetical protein